MTYTGAKAESHYDNSHVYLMDCMDALQQTPDKYYDLAVVDPPYGLNDWNERGSNKRLYRKKHMNINQIRAFEANAPHKIYFDELFRLSKHQIIWGGNHFLDYLGKTKQIIVWDKTIRGMHFNDCEIAWASGIKEACRIFTKSANDLNRAHPTQKPVALYDWIYHNYLPNGGKVIDTHLGSQSNRISADKAGNIDFYGFEIDEDYFNTGNKRFQDYKRQLKLF